MKTEDYSNRELDRMFKEIQDTLIRIEAQTTKTNGRVTRLETILLIAGAITLTVVAIKAPELLAVIKTFI